MSLASVGNAAAFDCTVVSTVTLEKSERSRCEPRECRDGGQSDLFRARLDEIVDLGHSLARLAATIDWRFLEERFGTVYTDKPGQPPLPTRLMAGLSSLKHTHNLSDGGLCTRWSENLYFQLLGGEEFFRHMCRSRDREASVDAS